MGKNNIARLPSVNKNIFGAFTAVVKYNEDLTVWTVTTLIKEEDNKKYNVLWLICCDREGPDGLGEIDMNNFPLLDTEAHCKCHSKLYEQLCYNLNILVPELVSTYPITDYDTEDPNNGYIDEKYTVSTDLLWAFKDKYKQTSADTVNNELDSITNLYAHFRAILKPAQTVTTSTRTGASMSSRGTKSSSCA